MTMMIMMIIDDDDDDDDDDGDDGDDYSAGVGIVDLGLGEFNRSV